VLDGTWGLPLLALFVLPGWFAASRLASRESVGPGPNDIAVHFAGRSVRVHRWWAVFLVLFASMAIPLAAAAAVSGLPELAIFAPLAAALYAAPLGTLALRNLTVYQERQKRDSQMLSELRASGASSAEMREAASGVWRRQLAPPDWVILAMAVVLGLLALGQRQWLFGGLVLALAAAVAARWLWKRFGRST